MRRSGEGYQSNLLFDHFRYLAITTVDYHRAKRATG